MKPVEIVLRRRGRGKKENNEVVNPTKIYVKHICKYHSINPVQLLYVNKIIKKESSAPLFSPFSFMLFIILLNTYINE
jgi:hypothetical protein